MAASSQLFSSQICPQFQPTTHRQSSSHSLIYPKFVNIKSISASLSESPPPLTSSQPPPPPPPPLSASTPPTKITKLPIRKIPGDYGFPVIGPWKDRLDYFYNQGRNEFFKSRIQKHNSTVFKTNMPPGPLITFDTKVIVLLDGKSFPILFDTDKVEKKDLFTGIFMPSVEFTGGYRVLSYLDPSEPNHAKLKRLMFFLLSSRRDYVIPEFHNSYSELFEVMENEISTKGKADFNQISEKTAFHFLIRSFFGADPSLSNLGDKAPKLIGKWVLFQLHPILVLGLPNVIEDVLLHTFRLPSALIKKDYQSLYDFFYKNSTSILDEAERTGISRDEACHNLIFTTCFNSFGGMKIFFPNMLKWIGRSGVKLQNQLASEIRSVISSFDNKITMKAIENMPLLKSVVYESLRIEPPVPSQYGRAKSDFIIESHDYAFKVKKGEILFGFQPFATKDPKIFVRPEEFVPDRFLGEEGENLLRYVVWSNGPETEAATLKNKQCAGKDFVVLVSRLLLVELFLRYDSFDIEVAASPLGAAVTFTSLKRASF